MNVDPVIVLYAFRYALGRMSYAVGDVAAVMIANAPELEPWANKIVEEIEYAVTHNQAGWATDVEQWQTVAATFAGGGR